MRTKFAKGFTLVEILVVVIIMGILAAVAVPKLFGSVAKAKSSELTVASGVYMRLQDAAVMSHGSVGNWKTIGYDAPGTGEVSKYFKYNEGNLTESNTKIEDLGDGMVGWEASNFVALGGCKTNSLWQISLSAGEGNHVKYTHSVNSAACLALASSFNQGDIASVGNNSESSESAGPLGHVVGKNIFVNGANEMKPGAWHESGPTNKRSDAWDVAWYSTHNTANNEGKYAGLFELEPNSTYEFTIAVPADAWDASQGHYMQTNVRVYTENDPANFSAIMLATRPEDQKAATDPGVTGYVYEKDAAGKNVYQNGNGYNTGSGKNKGYTAESTIKTVGDMVVTTVTMTTGNDPSYFGANFFSSGVGYGGYATDANLSVKRAAMEEAISKATLVKTKDNSNNEESSSK